MKSEMKLLREQWKKESLAQYWSSAKAIDHKETISVIHTGKLVLANMNTEEAIRTAQEQAAKEAASKTNPEGGT